MAGNRCFHGLRRHLRSNILTTKTNVAIYKTLINPVILYGSECWQTTKSDEELLYFRSSARYNVQYLVPSSRTEDGDVDTASSWSVNMWKRTL